MPLNNLSLLQSTQGVINLTGQPVRASGASRAVGSLYTVAVSTTNFRGRLFIEGTLATSPSEDDWFPITMPNVTTAYIDYVTPTTSTQGFNFKGSFSWVRARMDRTHLALDQMTSQEIATYGYIDSVLLNMGTWDAEQTQATTGPSYATIESVSGNNVGDGAGVYSGSIGQSNRILNFKTIKAGNGVTIVSDSQTVTISSTGTGQSGGSSGGGSSGVTSFVALTDTPNEIINNGVMIGGPSGSLIFVTPPTATGQTLTSTANSVAWTTPAETTVAVKDEGTLISQAKTINFVGNGVTVTNDGPNIAKVTINTSTGGTGTADSPTEYVMFSYTAGNSGNLSAVDALVSKSAGVSYTIVDPVNSVVAFTFSGRSFPPTSIAVMGQVYSTNEFNYTNVNAGFATRKIAGGGTAAVPTLLTSFAGPITLQIRMADSGASAGVGQRSKVAVLFRF